ncbi:acyltransferase-domain-containing protein [Acaromyces ingoldii]|uniref:Acyltransferase-domain-containing protein n=1 Tax=Acaromyces ingoldii TaxID=215250 RepID=A0A316YMI5_9BASI|nr:acyltransferase-domain-containing protein [Acaromyces ingoldii]PWN90411.1 acyltransferase-domain-containing protein [Acaromyces ingoldii]
MSKMVAQEWTVPIPKRTTPPKYLQTGVFAVLFNTSIILANLTQFLALGLYPLPITRPYYERAIAYTKLSFARLLVAISQLFGPTKLVVSCSDPQGNALDPERIVKRRVDGTVSHVELPSKSVWISNHQVYTDWLYLWCLAYYGDLADSILIILKDSLKWIPFVGWGMQFFRFIFLARNWLADKGPLAKHLAFMASKARSVPTAGQQGSATDLAVSRSSPSKLLLLIFPEGTLVSALTRPTSKKFAEKQDIADCRNLLLPRSTGLLFCLRSLAADISDLKLVDFTIGYPGIPPAGYGQSYYTLRSIFMQGVPPPAVHIHFTILPSRSTDPQDKISPPLGKLPTDAAEASRQESSQEEKTRFEAWLLNRWRNKDDLMDRFYRDGDFVGGQYGRYKAMDDEGKRQPDDRQYVEVPVELKSIREFGDIICWAAPVWAGLLVYKAIQMMR